MVRRVELSVHNLPYGGRIYFTYRDCDGYVDYFIRFADDLWVSLNARIQLFLSDYICRRINDAISVKDPKIAVRVVRDYLINNYEALFGDIQLFLERYAYVNRSKPYIEMVGDTLTLKYDRDVEIRIFPIYNKYADYRKLCVHVIGEFSRLVNKMVYGADYEDRRIRLCMDNCFVEGVVTDGYVYVTIPELRGDGGYEYIHDYVGYIVKNNTDFEIYCKSDDGVDKVVFRAPDKPVLLSVVENFRCRDYDW